MSFKSLGIILLFLLLIGVIAYLGNIDNTNENFLSQISLSLFTGYFAGIITPLILYLATGETLRKTVFESMILFFGKNFSYFFPIKSFPEEKEQKTLFNKILNHALSESLEYKFVGETGIHIAPRIKHIEAISSYSRNIGIVLFLPKREIDLNKKYKVYGLDFNLTVREALLISLYNLREIALTNPTRAISITFTHTNLGFRYEITDNYLFFTESNNSPTSSYFPKSHQFAKDSMLYRTLANLFNFLIQDSSYPTVNLSNLSDVKFQKLIDSLEANMIVPNDKSNQISKLFQE